MNSDGVVNVARCLTFPREFPLHHLHFHLLLQVGPLNDVRPKMAIAMNRMDSRNVPELSQRLKGRKETVKTGEQRANCGRETPCQNGEASRAKFASFLTTGEITFSFFSGKNKDDFPQICVNGVL